MCFDGENESFNAEFKRTNSKCNVNFDTE